MKRENLISVIIPVYNAEKYVRNVFDNLSHQTYKNFEVIVTYDEKTVDNTLNILQEIQESNLGFPIVIDSGRDSSLGEARNRGRKLSKGNFIINLDVDDEILPEYLESFINIFNRYPELDVACCNRLVVSEAEVDKQLLKTKEMCKSAEIVLYNRYDACMLKVTSQISNGTWVYMFKKEYADKYHIWSPDYTMREDYVFTLRLLEYTDKLGYYTGPVHLYIQHPQSALHGDFATKLTKFDESHRDLSDILQRIDLRLYEEFKIREEPIITAAIACKSNYRDFNILLHDSGIKKLVHSTYPEGFTKKVSITVFNVSKILYYLLSRCLNVKTNHLSISRIWKN